ncbi:hypothetical protein MPER_09207, partial [Moniliophthora perniciosa FA553]
MKRYDCKGYLNVTLNKRNITESRIRLTHHLAHNPYVSISIPDNHRELIKELKSWTPSKIWDRILETDPETELTEKQVHAEWRRINQDEWLLDKTDQVKSALMLLQKFDSYTAEVISITQRPGASAIAFSFKEIMDELAETTEEVAMDSTWKTNAFGYELYAIVGEANGEAYPLTFMFTTQDHTAAEGTKDLLLRDLISFVDRRCPNIKFTLSDKDTAEINAFRHIMPDKKHQLCYWHAIRYIEKRLAENRPPAAYDPRQAAKVFSFIDPTWAPGVTIGWLEDGVHPEDAEVERPSEPLKVRINLEAMKASLVSQEPDALEKLEAELRTLEVELAELNGQPLQKPAAPLTP